MATITAVVSSVGNDDVRIGGGGGLRSHGLGVTPISVVVGGGLLRLLSIVVSAPAVSLPSMTMAASSTTARAMVNPRVPVVEIRVSAPGPGSGRLGAAAAVVGGRAVRAAQEGEETTGK